MLKASITVTTGHFSDNGLLLGFSASHRLRDVAPRRISIKIDKAVYSGFLPYVPHLPYRFSSSVSNTLHFASGSGLQPRHTWLALQSNLKERDMIQFYAQPYDISATGFYFSDMKEYDQKYVICKNDFDGQVEEFEI